MLGFLLSLLAGCGDSSAPDVSYQKIGTPAKRMVEITTSQIPGPIRNELTFLVNEIATSVAQWTWLASRGSAPSPKDIEVKVTEPAELTPGDPKIHLEIRMGANPAVSQDVVVHRAWGPANYQALAQAILSSLKVTPKPPGTSAPAALEDWLQPLLDGKNTTLQKENSRLSADLQASILEPVLHEKASILLGVLAWKEKAGMFHESRIELARATAHLTFANALRDAMGAREVSPYARLADLLLITGARSQKAAMEALADMEANRGIPANWIRMLEVENTGDYRRLQPIKDLRPFERQVWARAKARMVGGTTVAELVGENAISKDLQLVRCLAAHGYSIQWGHVISSLQLKMELDDFAEVYRGALKKPLESFDPITALNGYPGHSIDDQGAFAVISPGLWSAHYQRHLCNALLVSVSFLRNRLGMPEEATNAVRVIRKTYQALNLFPALERLQVFETVEEPGPLGTEKFAPALAHPEIVPTKIWITISDRQLGRGLQPLAVTGTEWLKYGPLPQSTGQRGLTTTAFGSAPRFSPALNTDLRKMAPYDTLLIWTDLQINFSTNSPSSEVQAAWQPVLEYSVQAVNSMAALSESSPTEYERWMLKAIDYDPSNLLRLGAHQFNENPPQPEKAERYLRRGYDLADDRVMASNYARYLVDYYVEKERWDDARKIAEDASSTYSAAGLKCMAVYHEARKEYALAKSWLEKGDERYRTREVLHFALRLLGAPDGVPPEVLADLRQYLESHHPKPLTSIKLADLTTPPKQGVRFTTQSDLMKEVGLSTQDVVVALDGQPVSTVDDYMIIRAISPSTNLVLFLWDGKAYRELVAHPPNKRFGVDMRVYYP